MTFIKAAVMVTAITAFHISGGALAELQTPQATQLPAAEKPSTIQPQAPASPPAANPPKQATNNWLDPSLGGFEVSLRALTALFVLAILIESALSVIFNWRLYLKFFSNRGMKTLIMIGVAALVVWTFNIDILEKMLASYGVPVSSESFFLSNLLTALILAGGSAGVYKILVALGYREARSAADVQL